MEKKGVYSVRSAYRAIFGDVECESHASASSDSNMWGKVWHANTLPRVKIFFWRACHGALPTRKGLSKRVPGMEAVCSLCEAEVESELHCLKECVIARMVWDESGIGAAVEGVYRSFGDLAMACFERLPREEHGLFMTVCWAIWTARNRWLFEGEACDPGSTMAYVHSLMSELEREVDSSPMLRVGGEGRWQPPDEGWVKLNVDGGCVEGLGACVGAVIRGEEGIAKLAAAWKVEDRWEPIIAEAKAVLLGMQVAIEFGYRKVIVESDCLHLINAISSHERGGNSLHLIIDDIVHASNLFESVSWSFVRR